MREYLLKTEDGTYQYHNENHDVCPKYVEKIEVPEGATAARLCDDVEFYKNDFGVFFSRTSGNWLNTISPRGVLMKNIVWKRHTLPEELPFVDDEPKIKIGELYVDLKVNVDVDVSSSPFDTQIGGSHYKSLAIQPMRYALENKLDYAQSNVVKYVTRHASKGGKEDLLKAIHNIDLMIAHYYP